MKDKKLPTLLHQNPPPYSVAVTQSDQFKFRVMFEVLPQCFYEAFVSQQKKSAIYYSSYIILKAGK